MKWVITDHVHYDRVAACWLVKRFIDKDAEFLFAPRTTPLDQLPKDAVPMGFAGGKIGGHDEHGPMFLKVIQEYKLKDPVLDLMADVVGKGVHYVVDRYRPPMEDRYGQLSIGLLAFADGMILYEPSDAKRLDDSYIVWDSIYALFKANKQRL